MERAGKREKKEGTGEKGGTPTIPASARGGQGEGGGTAGLVSRPELTSGTEDMAGFSSLDAFFLSHIDFDFCIFCLFRAFIPGLERLPLSGAYNIN